MGISMFKHPLSLLEKKNSILWTNCRFYSIWCWSFLIHDSWFMIRFFFSEFYSGQQRRKSFTIESFLFLLFFEIHEFRNDFFLVLFCLVSNVEKKGKDSCMSINNNNFDIFFQQNLHNVIIHRWQTLS